jgi:NAD(P)-dependent dehydrogenase (short-subunit alcohol dehydrogenase family)
LVSMADQSLSACPGRLKDRIAVVTAAAGGIGGATALRLARDGAKAVVAIDTSANVNQMQESIKAAGSEGLGIWVSNWIAPGRRMSLPFLPTSFGDSVVHPTEGTCYG